MTCHMQNICTNFIQPQLNPVFFLEIFVRIILTFFCACVCFNICKFMDPPAMCTLPVCPVEGSTAKFDDPCQKSLLILSVLTCRITGLQ